MNCKDCFHDEVCGRHNRLVQIDEHTWDEYALLDNVEEFCEHFKNKADIEEVVRCGKCAYGTRAYGCLNTEKGLRGEFVNSGDFCCHGERE